MIFLGFRPLAGSKVSEQTKYFLSDGRKPSFRPLAGSKVSEQCKPVCYDW